MRRLWIISILLVINLLLSGCGNRTELNELGITSATGMDKKGGKWIVTYQVIIPSAMTFGAGGSSGGGGSQSAVHTFSTEGSTIREAVDVSNLENPRKLYFAHNNIVFIGKQAAEEGIADILDTYFAISEARETVKIIIADGEARDLLEMLVPPEKIPGHALTQILVKDDQLGSFFPSVSMFEVAMNITSESGAVGIPEISVVGTDGEKLKSNDIFTQTSTKSKLKLSGLSVFKGDKRVSSLNRKESLGVTWLNNKMEKSTISFKDEPSAKGLEAYTAFRILHSKVKSTPVKGSSHYTLKVKAEVSGEMVEASNKKNLTNSKGIDKLEYQIEKIIESQILDGWNSVQKEKTDLINIGNKIHRIYPKDWKKIKNTWPDDMAKMDIIVEVKAEIKRPGLFQNSYKKLLGP
ncbi:MAG: Ger(x)C family spore germination protein [Paenibacillus sp.]|nr:Ger(x)C family spore germination protein [Paenibacillus sp.]